MGLPLNVPPFDNPGGSYPAPNGPGAVHDITYAGQVM